MKKLLSVFLSLALMLALAVPAAAYDGIGSDEWDLPDQAQWQERLDAVIEAAGGVPGQVNVMVNGRCVDFPYAVPEITDGGRTMVPMRAILEALGAEVVYDDATKTAQASLGDLTLTHVVGSDLISSSDGNDLTMDTASYVRDGSTLVPVRFFSQALGYEVYWDDVYRAVVLIDKDAVVQDMDSGLSILNMLMAKRGDFSGNQKMDVDFSGTLQMPGSDEIPFALKLSALYNENTTNVSGTMDLSFLPPLLDAMGEDIPEELSQLPDDFSFQGIFSNGMMWVESPVLTQMYQEIEGGTTAGELWFQTVNADLQDALGNLFDLYDAGMNANVTMGEVLYQMAEAADAETPFVLYADLEEAASMVTMLWGDSTFVKEGDTYSWSLENALPELLLLAGVSFPVSAQLTIREDGSCEYAVEIDYEDVMTADITGVSDAASGSMEGRIQIVDVCDLVFQMRASLLPSEEAPADAPPAGAEIIPLD